MDHYIFTLPAPPAPAHKHKCPKCGCVWEHGDECAGSDEDHTCPRCGKVNFWRYDGNEGITPMVRDDYTFRLRD